jgi:peptidoglycan/LPS O-acetylase OafA/YrhL
VEEHFYLAWPLLVWLTIRRQIMLLAVAAITVSMIARIVLYRHGADLDTIFGLTPLRMDGLAIGALASIAIRGRAGLDAIAPWAWATLAVTGTVLACLLALHHVMYQTDPAMWIFGYPLVAMATAAALLASITNGPVGRILSVSPLRWFGKYSFGLYVWHPIIGLILLHSHVAIVSEASGKHAVLLAASAALVLDLTVAWLSFNL